MKPGPGAVTPMPRGPLLVTAATLQLPISLFSLLVPNHQPALKPCDWTAAGLLEGTLGSSHTRRKPKAHLSPATCQAVLHMGQGSPKYGATEHATAAKALHVSEHPNVSIRVI